MSGAGFPSEPRGPGIAPAAGAAAAALAPVRVVGGVELEVRAEAGRTRLAHLRERGGYRLKFPHVEGPWLEAVQLNTGGGVAGGDRLAIAVEVGRGADAVYATQAPERVYRSLGPAAELDVTISVANEARLDWLPQETLLYSGARLQRRFEVDVGESGRLLMVEAVTFGRIASGEIMRDGLLHDVWRVRRAGRLVLAEGLRLDGDIAGLLARPAIAAGGRAAALLLDVAEDAADRLDAVRAAIAGARSVCGASAWNGMLVARFLAADPADLRRDVRAALGAIGRRPLPRVWA